jgi:MoaA/NifB/PqqE/SkfB family radical SAM enzyme
MPIGTSWRSVGRTLRRLPRRIPDFAINRWRLGHDRPPRVLTYTVTFRCNARCIMCDSWRKDGRGDLELSQIESIFRQLPAMVFVRLTGGEPFVRPDLIDILALVTERLKPLGVHITTNGFLTDRIIALTERRDQIVPLQLMVSLDGLEKKHNQIRGSDLAWRTAWSTLERLAQRRDNLNLDLVVNQTVVDREGIDHVEPLRDLLNTIGVRHQLVMAYEASATYSQQDQVELNPDQLGDFATFGEFHSEDLLRLFALMEEDLKRWPWWLRRAKSYYVTGMRQRLLAEPKLLNPSCTALLNHLRLFPNGDVPTCQFNSKIVGNLVEQTFETLWSGAERARQRGWVRNCPGCWAECEVMPNALYSLELLKPIMIARETRTGHVTAPQEPLDVSEPLPPTRIASCESDSQPVLVELSAVELRQAHTNWTQHRNEAPRADTPPAPNAIERPDISRWPEAESRPTVA